RSAFNETTASDGEALEQREVGPPVARPAQRVAREVAEGADGGTRERAARRSDRRRIEPLFTRLRPVRIADQVRAVRRGIAIGVGTAIGDVEWQPALNDRRLIERPAAQPGIVSPERQLVGRRQAEVVLAIPVGRSVLEAGSSKKLVGAMLALALQRVLGEDRIAGGEPLGQLGLQRIVSIRGAVAEDVEILCPSVLAEVWAPVVARHARVSVERGLVAIHARTVAD